MAKAYQPITKQARRQEFEKAIANAAIKPTFGLMGVERLVDEYRENRYALEHMSYRKQTSEEDLGNAVLEVRRINGNISDLIRSVSVFAHESSDRFYEAISALPESKFSAPAKEKANQLFQECFLCPWFVEEYTPENMDKTLLLLDTIFALNIENPYFFKRPVPYYIKEIEKHGSDWRKKLGSDFDKIARAWNTSAAYQEGFNKAETNLSEITEKVVNSVRARPVKIAAGVVATVVGIGVPLAVGTSLIPLSPLLLSYWLGGIAAATIVGMGFPLNTRKAIDQSAKTALKITRAVVSRLASGAQNTPA